MLKNIFFVLIAIIVCSLHSEELHSKPERNNNNNKIVAHVEKYLIEKVIEFDKEFIWKEDETCPVSQLNGYLDNEIVATANKIAQSDYYELFFIFIDRKQVASINVIQEKDTFIHSLKIEKNIGYKVLITSGLNENNVIVEIKNDNNKVIRNIKINAKKNLIHVGPVNKDIPWR